MPDTPVGMWTPQAILERLASHSLLPDQMFDALDADAVLEARDDSFDDDWIRTAETVEAAWRQSPEAEIHAARIDEVRETTFKRAFGASGGSHELAASVSDDFEIICKRALLGIESSFIAALEEAYDTGQVPH